MEENDKCALLSKLIIMLPTNGKAEFHGLNVHLKIKLYRQHSWFLQSHGKDLASILLTAA